MFTQVPEPFYKQQRRGNSPLRFVERQDEGRARGCAPVPGQGIGAALRCLFTHPPGAINSTLPKNSHNSQGFMEISGATHSTLPKNLHNSQGFKDIHGELYVWRYIWEYVCVEERVIETPLRLWRLYAWWRERESEREGEGRGGGRERATTLRQNHSTSTAHQSIDTRSKTL